jgi:hypothetical protein
MNTFNNQDPHSFGTTVFTVRVGSKTYRCPVSQAAMYELCRTQDPRFDRIDAYLALKAKISRAVTRLIEGGSSEPPLLQPEHFAS